MRNSTRFVWAAAAAVAVAALAPAGGVRAQDPPAARALKVGVVNLGDCFDPAKYDYARDLEADFNAVRKNLDEELVRIRKGLEERTKTLDALSDKTSTLYVQKYTEIKVEEAHYDIVQKMRTNRLLNARYSGRNLMYAEVRKATASVAQEQKLDLVFRADESSVDDEKGDESQSLQKNMLRSVLYCDPSLDITAKVLARLNDDYRKRKPASGEIECPQCKIKTKEAKCPRCGAVLKN
ncbi:MAG TPA: OmpH family outer membrane protein [Planctomycetota bacterium]|jgi:Skp family chaperone for outer membrane proteins